MASEKNIFDIEFEVDGAKYIGWVNPSDKFNDSGVPVSYHVVLNDALFGQVSRSNDEWTVNQDRPAGIIEQVGKAIEKHYAF